MALGLTQPLTEVSTKNISWGGGKGGQCIQLTLPPSCVNCLEIWEPQTSWNPLGLSRPVMGLLLLLYIPLPCWLTHCATSRKVVGSVPNGVVGIFC